eukprot:gene656-1324_t
MNQALLEEPELLSEVPPILKRLAKMTAYAFYEAEHIAIVSLLAVVPCVDEDSLIERLSFDKRQLRQALARLRVDKLVKQRVHKEKQPDTGNFNVYNFYFINYKIFVNVVKYKLDHIRKKLESDEQMAKNRPSFTCSKCENKYSDLEVDRLLDFTTGLLKCTYCGGSVEEDASHEHRSLNKSSLALFNEQMEPIFKLLRACENINLAPEVLEPEPTTVQLKAAANRTHSNHAKSGWSVDRKAIDLYDQSISINVGENANKTVKTEAPKELPVWMSQSTVFNTDENKTAVSDVVDSKASNDKGNRVTGDTDIMSDLLAHESNSSSSKKLTINSASQENLSEDSEPDSVDESSAAANASNVVTKKTVSYQEKVMDIVESEEDEDGEGVMVKVGKEMIPISDVVNDHSITERMTPEEHEKYLHLYHKYCEQFF